MAMTMSDNINNNMSASNDWLQFYQQQHFQGVMTPSSVSDANTVTTTTATTVGSTTSPPLQAAMFNNVNSGTSTTTSSTTTGHLSPEGRVAKPIRRRSRASRRTPTTLLNTDTTNFRAMVQQFTGGPTAPFAPSSSSSSVSGLGLAFGFGPSRQAHLNPTGLMVAPPGYHHHHQQQQQQLYHHHPQQQNQQYVFNSNNNTEGGENNNNNNNSFFQRLNNPRPPNVSDHGGFVMDQGGRFFPSSS